MYSRLVEYMSVVVDRWLATWQAVKRYCVSPTCLKCLALTVSVLNIISTVSPPTDCCVPRRLPVLPASTTACPQRFVDDRERQHHCASSLADSFVLHPTCPTRRRLRPSLNRYIT